MDFDREGPSPGQYTYGVSFDGGNGGNFLDWSSSLVLDLSSGLSLSEYVGGPVGVEEVGACYLYDGSSAQRKQNFNVVFHSKESSIVQKNCKLLNGQETDFTRTVIWGSIVSKEDGHEIGRFCSLGDNDNCDSPREATADEIHAACSDPALKYSTSCSE